MSEHLDLADYRRRVGALYAALRDDTRAEARRLVAFRAAKDRLFGEHPQSPIPAVTRHAFGGLAYWRHDPALRFDAPFEPDADAPDAQLPLSGAGDAIEFARIGWVSLTLDSAPRRLAIYWLAGYGGGIFVPFRDATSGRETYGGGRYLWDSVKGADLGSGDGRLVIDFNYAYHPSCTYDARWSCPLAPLENHLDVPIRVGERLASQREDEAA